MSLTLLGVNALAYLLTVLAARLLDPAAFGELASLLGLLLVGTVPATAVQTVAALRIGGCADPEQQRREVRAAHTASFAVAAAVAVVAVALAPLLVLLLDLSPWTLFWLGAMLLPHTVVGAYDGILQGEERHSALATVLCAFGAAKVVGGIGGLVLGDTPAAVLAGMTAGALGGVVVGWLVAGRPGIGGTIRPLVAPILRAAGALLGFVVLTNVDVFLARHLLPPFEAGHYAVGSIVFKIAFWLPQGVTVLLVPRLAKDGATRQAAMAFALVAVPGAVLVGGVAVAQPLVAAVLGAATPAVTWTFALLGILLALGQLLTFQGIATADRLGIASVWVAVVAECLLCVLAPWSPTVATISLTAVTVAFTMVTVGAVRAFAGISRPGAAASVRLGSPSTRTPSTPARPS